MKKLYTICVALCLTASIWAQRFNVDGIYYNITDATNLTVEVTHDGDPFDDNWAGYTSSSIAIPETVSYGEKSYRVTSIGEDAFRYSENITSIILLNTVTSIDDYAFANCESLSAITLPNTLTNIGAWAFSYCNNLIEITIPESVETIGNNPFANCTKLNSITVDSNNKHYSSVDGVLYNKDVTTLISYPIGNLNTELTIPNTVRTIANSAFDNCKTLTNVTLPNLLTTFDLASFSGCSGLGSITIPNTVTYLSGNAFSYCTNLESITIGGGVINIGSYAFFNCSNVNQIISYATNPPELEQGTFENVPTTLTLTVPPNSKALYEAADVWKKFNIVEDASLIINNFYVDGIYYNITDATNLTVEVTHDGVHNDDNKAGYTSSSIAIPETVSYGEKSYRVTSIGENAFYYSANLTSITIPNTVTNIGFGAFRFCKYLSTATLSNSITSIDGYAFANCESLSAITLPNTLTNIGFWAFMDCKNLTEITIPELVETIGSNPFNGNEKLSSITVDSNNKHYSSVDGVLYNKDVTTLISYPIGNLNTELTIPNTVRTIANSAFRYCKTLTDVTLPNLLTTIEQSSFSRCSGLGSITIPNSVTYIGFHAFSYCTSLESITIGGGVTNIDSYAFSGCSNVNQIISYATNPPALEKDAFKNVPTTLTLTVPPNSKTRYEVEDVWKEFNIVEDASLSVEQPQSIQPFSQQGNTLQFDKETNFAIYSLNGACIYKGTAQSYTLTQKGVYIVATKNGAFKIIGK